MRVLYFDCFSGAAGDMVLGALLDAGLPLEALRAALGPMLPPGAGVTADRVVKRGIAATKFRLVQAGASQSPEPHADHHHHGPDAAGGQHHHPESPVPARPHAHGHRTMAEIHALIDSSSLSAKARQGAGALFDRLADAEAAIHQVPVERIHLHEVGALDSIVDIVGAVFALEWFAADRILSSPLNVGGGTVETAHGILPVPAPATLRLLEGVPVYSRGEDGELVTPTGALLVTGHASAFGPMPAMTVERIGYGAGDRELPHQANVLRVTIGRTGEGDGPHTERLLVVECEIDDMNPQLFGPVSDRLFAAGALDVFLTSVQMKKGRPGTLLTVLAPDTAQAAMVNLLFRETTTLGVRYDRVWRETLDRRWETVVVRGGQVRIKVASRAGETLDATPEFDDCVRVADATGRAVRDVQAEAVRAWAERGAAASPIE